MAVDLGGLIRDIPDFPIEGILFKDISPLLEDAEGFQQTIDQLTDRYRDARIDKVVAIESRGFIFGAPLAYQLGCGFVPIRKPGKLPAKTIQVEYSLEYGTNVIEMHVDAVDAGERVLLVDDLLATGGSAKAAIELIERLKAEVAGVAFVIELGFLQGRANLSGYDVFSIIQY